MNREKVTSKKYAQLLAPAVVTDTGSSAYLDLQGFDALDIIVSHGAVTASAGANNFVITVQEKNTAPATAAGYTTVAAADLVGAFTTLENAVGAGVQVVGYRGSARYVRVLITETGTASAAIGVVAALQLSDRDPANAKSVTTGAVS
jgi:hypothetical protein